MVYLLNLCVIIVSLLFTMFDVKLNLLIGIEGAVSGFFIVYNVPTLMHWQCLKSKMYCEKLNLTLDKQIDSQRVSILEKETKEIEEDNQEYANVVIENVQENDNNMN